MGLESSLVAILGPNKLEQPVGAGVLLDDERILTCAHVVNSALGRSEMQTGHPGERETIRVRFHSAQEEGEFEAAIDKEGDSWSDPPEHRAEGADLCVLRLTKPRPSSARPASLRAFVDPVGREFRAAGYPPDWNVDFAVGRIVGRDEMKLYLLRPDPAVLRATASGKGLFRTQSSRPAGLIHKGFSGGPVEINSRIAGLVSAVRPNFSDATAYMIPASVFPKSVNPLVEAYQNKVAEQFAHVRELPYRLDKLAKNKEIDTTVFFDIRLRLCNDFISVLDAHRTRKDAMLRGEENRLGPTYEDGRDLRPHDLAQLLKRGMDEGGRPLSKICLHAPGGAGKSSFLIGLLRAAADEDLVPFLLDFSSGGSDGEKLASRSAVEELKFWFNTFHNEGTVDDLMDLIRDESGLKPLLVVDGCNQARLNWEKAIQTIDRLGRGELAGAAIIVADRMVQRGDLDTFRFAAVPPLVHSAYTSALEGIVPNDVISDPNWVPIFSSPLFLGMFRKILQRRKEKTGEHERQSVSSRFSILDNYYREYCEFNQKELRVLADTAFEAYDLFRQTAIPQEKFDSILGKKSEQEQISKDELEKKIDKYGLIHQLGTSDIEFRHQILHDHLAALKIASCREEEEERLLRAAAFDALSLDAASPDSIELAVEALQEPDKLLAKRHDPLQARAFLTEVYDWNYWIALQCIASFDRRSVVEPPIPSWMRHAIYALNIEKRFDPFLHTAARAEDLRKQISRSADVDYADCEEHDALIRRIEDILRDLGSKDSDDYGRTWRDLYTRREPFSRDDLYVLWRDPLLSWTATNVIRRLEPSEELAAELIRLYDISRATSDSAARAAGFRWRIVHTLGRAPVEAVEKILIQVTFDRLENHHVRYGAVRSLVEVAASSARLDKCAAILQHIEDHLNELFYQFGSVEMDLSEREGVRYVARIANVRRELRRACAFNEKHFQGHEDWLPLWLSTGLEHYGRILRKGEILARENGLEDEATRWKDWYQAVEKVKGKDADWTVRREVWLSAINKDR